MSRRDQLVGALLISVISAALALGRTLPSLTPQRNLASVVLDLRLDYPLWAVLGGWLGAWAMQMHSPESVIVGPASARSRISMITRQLARVAVPWTVGLMLGLLPAVITTMKQFHFNASDVISVIAFVLGVASLVPVGAFLGSLVRFPISMVVAPLAAVALVVLPAHWVNDLVLNYQVNMMPTSYMWSLYSPLKGMMLTTGVQVIQCLFFVAVGISATLATAAVSQWRAGRDPRDLVGMGWLAVPVAMTAVVAPLHLSLDVDDPEVEVACQPVSSQMQLCLFPSSEAGRADLNRFFAPLDGLLPGENPVVLSQDNNAAPGAVIINGSLDDPTVDIRSISATIFPLPPGKECQQVWDDGVNRVVFSLEAEAIQRAEKKVSDPDVAKAYSEILGEARQLDHVEGAFDHLSDAEFIAWVEAHAAGIRACTITEDELP